MHTCQKVQTRTVTQFETLSLTPLFARCINDQLLQKQVSDQSSGGIIGTLRSLFTSKGVTFLHMILYSLHRAAGKADHRTANFNAAQFPFNQHIYVEDSMCKFWSTGDVAELRQALLDEIKAGGNVEAAAEALSAAQPARNAGKSQQLKVQTSPAWFQVPDLTRRPANKARSRIYFVNNSLGFLREIDFVLHVPS